ncbi:pentapeptide repeat-containing protein [Pseudarthrobacter sp. TAF60_1]|uniref:pentapeptide repeat-containing protein n=1 Tax=Pseudarthrobacter sp. TAF60_1 TaxID=3233071 RepID=UPI003F99BE25
MVAASPEKAKEPSQVPSKNAQRVSRRKFSLPLLLLEVGIALASGGLSGTVVAAWSVSEQARIDDIRSEREGQREELRSAREARQENLRFVRDRSSSQVVERPFQEIDLTGQNLTGLKLSGADFSGAVLKDAKLGRSDLVGTNLREADLSGAELNSANMQGASLFQANLKDANLVSANLRGANLAWANLEGAILVLNDVRRVCYDDTTVWPARFTPPVTRCNFWPPPGNP